MSWFHHCRNTWVAMNLLLPGFFGQCTNGRGRQSRARLHNGSSHHWRELPKKDPLRHCTRRRCHRETVWNSTGYWRCDQTREALCRPDTTTSVIKFSDHFSVYTMTSFVKRTSYLLYKQRVKSISICVVQNNIISHRLYINWEALQHFFVATCHH